MKRNLLPMAAVSAAFVCASLTVPAPAQAVTYQAMIFNGSFYNASEIDMNGHCRTASLKGSKLILRKGFLLSSQTDYDYLYRSSYEKKWQWKVSKKTKYYYNPHAASGKTPFSEKRKVTKAKAAKLLKKASKKRSDHLDGHKIGSYLRKHPAYWIRIGLFDGPDKCSTLSIFRDA